MIWHGETLKYSFNKTENSILKKTNFPMKLTFENGPHARSTFSALQWTYSRGP